MAKCKYQKGETVRARHYLYTGVYKAVILQVEPPDDPKGNCLYLARFSGLPVRKGREHIDVDTDTIHIDDNDIVS